LDQRLKLFRYAIESSKSGKEHPSILLSRFCNSSVTAGDLGGAANALARAKFLLQNQTHKTAEVFVKAAEGFLLMNRGCFREASEIYRTLSGETWTMSAAILANRGVCLEHLGRIRSGIVLQLRAYRFAEKAGHLFGRIQCSANLGTFEVKLGGFHQAHEYFEEAKQLSSELYRTTSVSPKGIEAEPVCLNMLEGHYGTALRHLRSALESKDCSSAKVSLLLLQREVFFLLGAEIKTSN
jgi:tetratricopeptide (TPR) repeat protein